MAKYTITRTETKTYEVDVEELKAQFPNEYEDYLTFGDGTDRGFLVDSIEVGGFELFNESSYDEDYDIVRND